MRGSFSNPCLEFYYTFLEVKNVCECEEKDCEYKEGKLYWHEALDRAHVACDHFYEYVQQHIAVQHDEALEEAATAVTDAMRDFYQLVGRKSYDFDQRDGEV